MKRSRWFDWASVVVLAALAVMLGVFFSCNGTDDDDDGGSDGGNCAAIAEYLEDCWYDYFGLYGDYDARFMAWCNGAGYDEVGWWGIYDFDPYCFTGSCAEIYDKGSGWLPGNCVQY